jgi:SH3-like domain-containing protein
MKGFLTILICTLCQITFGQFGIIVDKEGSVNIRKSPEISNNVIDTLKNGQVVFCLEEEGEWRTIDYDLSRQNKTGYVHKSRVQLIEKFEKIPYSVLTESNIEFKNDSIKLEATKTKFTSKNNNLQYQKGNASKNEMSWLEKINGKEIWGTDGNLPKNLYGKFELTLGKDIIHLPIDNLYEPNLDYISVNIDRTNRTIYISALNSDGAGAYVVLWIIENGKFKQRITTIPF